MSKSSNLRVFAVVLSTSIVAIVSNGGLSPNTIAIAAKPTANPQLSVEVEYRLGPGDRLQIDFLNFPEYTQETQVLVDGSVNLPLVGQIVVEGLTLNGATATIRDAYAYYVRRPSLTVSLTEPRPLRLGVSGEVNRPGSYSISPIESGQFPTVTEALERAGGITQGADLRQVRVRRTQGGAAQTITVDLWALLEANDLSQDIVLRDGDEILVPTSAQVDRIESAQMAEASFAADATQPLNIAVVGEVARPGSYTVEVAAGEQPRLTLALEVAGGVTPTADIGQVRVRRIARTGEIQTISTDLWQLLRGGDRTQDLILQQGDTVVIPTAAEIDMADAQYLASASFAADRTQPLNIAVVGEVARPGPHVVNNEADPTGTQSLPTVTRAIQVAGGITQRADVREIEVRRIARDGSERVLEVDLWQLLEAGDLQQDVLLQPGDTIVVPTAEVLTPEETAQLAAASFSPETIAVNVIGEVENPGQIQVPPNTPLNQAILVAGGFNTRASEGEVELLRLNPDGTVDRRTIEIDLGAGLDDQNNPSLRANDVIVVDRSGITEVTDFIGQVVSPFIAPFRFFRLF
ncbi:MAG: SLBB domain-containing protein [Cyanobacteriota bacterium]|nr:SLBB domain-containing protein [Cyanobacteriota bacterium]